MCVGVVVPEPEPEGELVPEAEPELLMFMFMFIACGGAPIRRRARSARSCAISSLFCEARDFCTHDDGR
jgi:hypothetical protein